MKLLDLDPTTATTPAAAPAYTHVATSRDQRWMLAVDAEQRNLMVLYQQPGWEQPGILQMWACARPKHAQSGFRALKRLFRDLDERAPLDSVARRLPRTESAFPRYAS